MDLKLGLESQLMFDMPMMTPSGVLLQLNICSGLRLWSQTSNKTPRKRIFPEINRLVLVYFSQHFHGDVTFSVPFEMQWLKTTQSQIKVHGRVRRFEDVIVGSAKCLSFTCIVFCACALSPSSEAILWKTIAVVLFVAEVYVINNKSYLEKVGPLWNENGWPSLQQNILQPNPPLLLK